MRINEKKLSGENKDTEKTLLITNSQSSADDQTKFIGCFPKDLDIIYTNNNYVNMSDLNMTVPISKKIQLKTSKSNKSTETEMDFTVINNKSNLCNESSTTEQFINNPQMLYSPDIQHLTENKQVCKMLFS